MFKSACWFKHEIMEEKIMNENSDGNENPDEKEKQIENQVNFNCVKTHFNCGCGCCY